MDNKVFVEGLFKDVIKYSDNSNNSVSGGPEEK